MNSWGVAELSGEQREWLEALLRKFGTKGAVDRAAGLSEGLFWRQINSGKLGLRPLLRLAAATGENASTVLRRMKKGEDADLIEAVYGPPQEVRPIVRAFDAASQPPLPDAVVESAVEQLQVYRDAWLRRSGAGNAPPEVPQGGTHTRAKRASRGK